MYYFYLENVHKFKLVNCSLCGLDMQYIYFYSDSALTKLSECLSITL